MVVYLDRNVGHWEDGPFGPLHDLTPLEVYTGGNPGHKLWGRDLLKANSLHYQTI